MTDRVETSNDYEDIDNKAEKEAYAPGVDPYEEGVPEENISAAVGMSYTETEQRTTALNIATAGFANQFNPTGVVAAAEAFLAFLQGEEPPEDRAQYPFEDGDVIILGPECFASKDGNVISWRGENYINQSAVQRLVSSPPE